jgi:hypothetical protein
LHSPYINTTVTTTTLTNLYTYNQRNLLLAYGLAIFFALLANILGAYAYKINGVSFERGFSSFLSATRDPELVNLFHYQTLGKLPVPDHIKRTILVFGRLLLPLFGDMEEPGLGFTCMVQGEVKQRRGSKFGSL